LYLVLPYARRLVADMKALLRTCPSCLLQTRFFTPFGSFASAASFISYQSLEARTFGTLLSRFQFWNTPTSSTSSIFLTPIDVKLFHDTISISKYSYSIIQLNWKLNDTLRTTPYPLLKWSRIELIPLNFLFPSENIHDSQKPPLNHGEQGKFLGRHPR
jgi:hypothetical protein